jgi:hypothetical protein
MDARHFVFLSHNSADKPVVEELARRLRDAGIEPWLDSWHLVPGEKWQPALEKALTEARASAVFFGPSGVGPWQDEEMRVAIGRRVVDSGYRVVPVLLPGAQRGKRSAVPPFLANVTWVEFQRSLDEEHEVRPVRHDQWLRGDRHPVALRAYDQCPFGRAVPTPATVESSCDGLPVAAPPRNSPY